MNPVLLSTISAINKLPYHQKRELYSRLIPQKLLDRFRLNPSLMDPVGNDLLNLHCPPGSSTADMRLHHQPKSPDPVFYGQIADTVNGQVHVLLYILNDPDSPRFDVDRMPDGTLTQFGICCRNLEAEAAALQAGLAPGQIHRGLGLLGPAIQAFERFVEDLGHDYYFAEPLFYHTAVLFERYGFAYEKGRRLMERIQAGFQTPDGDLLKTLDCSNVFRDPPAASSVRLRSWAIHDGVLGEPFNNVTMYKRIGRPAGLNTSKNCPW